MRSRTIVPILGMVTTAMPSGIPPHTPLGVLPPFLTSPGGPSQDTSPYKTDMKSLVQRLGTSLERLTLIDGLIRYREDLRKFGARGGFQWIDGSFVEDPGKESRPPADIDVVTFADFPELTEAQVASHAHLFQRPPARTRYGLDIFVIPLGSPPEYIVRQTAYLFGLFSHRRGDMVQKGMLHVDFAVPGTEAPARKAAASAKRKLNRNSGELK